jgi:hypothetical protein
MIVESVGVRWMAKEEEFGVGCEEVYRFLREVVEREVVCVGGWK